MTKYLHAMRRHLWSVTVAPRGGGAPVVFAVRAWTETGARQSGIRRARMVWPDRHDFKVLRSFTATKR